LQLSKTVRGESQRRKRRKESSWVRSWQKGEKRTMKIQCEKAKGENILRRKRWRSSTKSFRKLRKNESQELMTGPSNIEVIDTHLERIASLMDQ
jgi:hypothetical protein